MFFGKLKKILSFAAVLCSTAAIFAIPGVSPSVPDSSGQFVYYRDYTFTRESYIGIMYYDESTYGIRYFSPADVKNSLPELSMLVLITIDPNKTSGVEFTGEKVDPFPSSQDETDIINYLHSFVYDLFPMRQKAGLITGRTERTEDYAQFGGEVKLEYDPMIPVLNLRKITTADKKTALLAVTGGQLVSSSDTSFVDFKGLPDKIADKSHSFKPIKKAKASVVPIETEGLPTQSVKIDSQWEQKSAGLWTLGNEAMLSVVSLPIASETQKLQLLRRLMLGSDHSYPNWNQLSIKETGSGTSVRQVFYDSKAKSFTYDFKELRNIADSMNSIFSLTVYAGSYMPNKKYFDSVVSSYTVTK